MTEFALVPSQMASASTAASGAAAEAGRADGADALATLAAGLPGTTTAEIMPALGDAWREGIDDWSRQAQEFADGVDYTSRDGTETDGAAGGLFGDLFGLFGGS